MADDDTKTKNEDQKVEEKVEEAKEAAEEAQEAAQEAKEVKEEVKDVEKEVKETVKEVKEKKEEAKPSPKVSKKLADLIEEIEKLSVLELSELVKALESKFGVSAAPVAVQGATGNGQAQEAAPEQTTFNVILADSGANKISVIKAVREIVQTLGLKEAKDLVDAAPKPVLEGVNKETATEAKTKLEAAGAKVELK